MTGNTPSSSPLLQSYTITEVTAEDIKYIHTFYMHHLKNQTKTKQARLSEETFHDYMTWYSKKELKKKITMEERENRIFLCARDPYGKIIGVLDGRKTQNESFVINWLIVAPEYREKGIGKELMQEAVGLIRDRYHDQILQILSYHSPENEQSDRIHTTAGFDTESREPHPDLYGRGLDGVQRVQRVEKP